MVLTLDGTGPRYAQITRALRTLVRDGVLAPGARVPPTRDLARDLGCSRNIVLLAYEQLLLEGYFVSRQGAGTFVSAELPQASPLKRVARNPSASSIALSARGRRAVELAAWARGTQARLSLPVDFMYGLCEPDARGVARLRASFNAALRSRSFLYGKPGGDAELRREVAGRIRAARGISRDPEQVVITSGVQQTLDVCARLLLDPGDRVVVEDPGYSAACAVFAAAGAEVVRVPVDRQGLDPSALPGDRHRVAAVYVTPSHQFPTGAVMSIARRYALLEWARRRGVCIIEDDYDGEFRYEGRPIAALAGLDPDGPVIYCGTFAKSLFPAMRLGYLTAPPQLIPAIANGKWLCDLTSSVLLQRTLAHLMATGEYDRHVRRMQKRYRSRRQALLRGLKRHLGTEVCVEGGGAGLHVAVWLPRLPHQSVDALIEACAAQHVGIYSIAGHASRRLPRAGLLMGYGLTDLDQIERGVRILGKVYRDVAARRPRRG
jgi:GntR family transcriptional regulator / MocR family aminotransferase